MYENCSVSLHGHLLVLTATPDQAIESTRGRPDVFDYRRPSTGQHPSEGSQVVAQSQDAEARTQFSRNTVQLLLQMKRRLNDHGISVSLTEPDTIAQILRASSKIDDPELKQCRSTLRANMPSSDRVYLFANPRSRLSCQRCQESFTVTISKQAGIANPQSVHCPCGALYFVGSQARQYARKDTELDGTYLHDETTGQVVVKNISYGGLQLRLQDTQGIAEQDKLLVQFTLDDRKSGSVIRETVSVRYIRGNTLGTQFIDSHGLPKALIDYLRG